MRLVFNNDLKLSTKACKSKGFTLIELLLALTIMAFVAGAATVFLQNIVASQGQLETREQAINGFDLGFRLLQEDLQFHLPGRPVRRSTAVDMAGLFEPEYVTLLANDFNRTIYELLPPLILEEQRLEFTRSGSYLPPNFAGKRSNLRRVQYQFHPDCRTVVPDYPEDLATGCLLRHLLDGLDAVVRQPNVVTQPLIIGLEDVNFSVLSIDDRGGQWVDRWPVSGQDAKAAAVRLEFDHQLLGRLDRTIGLLTYNAELWSPDSVSQALIGRGHTLPGEMVR